MEAIRAGQPRLPIEIDARVPEPLQAIALKAMERRPSDRYAAREIWRWTWSAISRAARCSRGRPCTRTTLASRPRPHLDQIAEWLRLKLSIRTRPRISRRPIARLDAREDDWIVASRALRTSQIALYLGAFLLFAGSLFYFVAHRLYDAASGIAVADRRPRRCRSSA